MRYVCPAAAKAVVLFLSVPFVGAAQSGLPSFSITNYQFVSEQRFSQTHSYITYRASLVNPGQARDAVVASLASLVSSVEVVAGQGNLRFAPVPADGVVTSSNTFTILVDRTIPFTFANLKWTFLAPFANAGQNRTVPVGTRVTLDGSGSTNPSGYGVLNYSWRFVLRPPGSNTVLTFADSVNPSFLVDAPGDYIIALTVNNGGGSDTAAVMVSTVNSPPAANAGPNQTVALGAIVTLDGTGSTDADGDALTYSWTLVSRPGGSAAVLIGSNTVAPVFIADKPGSYLVQLVVNDGKADSPQATVTVTTENTPPVANAGPNQIASVNSLVQLNGAGSSDVDGNPLTYRWSLVGLPEGSAATLNHPNAVNPTFTVDKPGTYIAQLIVNDGRIDSAAATTTITTNPVLAPTANAGLNQTVARRSTVRLSGSGTDPQSLPLTYQWSLTTKPLNSATTLTNATSANPEFVADLPGIYVAQLIVSNGYTASPPSTVTITTANTAPVANAGPNQTVPAGSQVMLDGGASSDSDGDTLTYSWSFNSRPAGSTAALSDPAAKSPTFIADVAGTYVAQLIVNDGFASSNPATVTIIAGIRTITLTPDPLNLAPGESSVITVTLGSPAGPGGVAVNLASDNTGVVSVQSSVTVAEGHSGVNAAVTAGAAGSATVSATAGGYSPGSTTVHVAPASITVTLDSANLGITRSMKGTVMLSRPAPGGGVTVPVSASPGGIVTVEPTSVTIAAGSTNAQFTITGAAVGFATISAAYPGYTSGSAGVTVGMLGAISLAAGVTVGLGQSAPLEVKLATGAPVGGVTVTLSSNNPALVSISPGSVFIPFAATVPDIQPQVTGVSLGSVVVSASAPGFYGDQQTVKSAASLSFSPPVLTLGAGGTQNLTLTLSGPAPSDLSIDLSSTNTAAATVPATVTIPAKATTATVPVTAVAAGNAVIHASALPHLADTTASVKVVNFGVIGLPQNTAVKLGQLASFPITLPSPAPAGDTVINLVSSDPAKVKINPATVTVAAGNTTPGTQPQVEGLDLGTVTISANAVGYASNSGTVQVTGTLSFSPATLTITGPVTQNLMLSLSAPAATPVTVNLTSGNPAAATVPATITLPANTPSVSVPVTGKSAGTATIRASGANLSEASAEVTVQNGGSIGLPANPTVGLGKSATLAITLPVPAPEGGVIVTLTSSDTSKVGLPAASVTVPAGQTTPATQPEITGLDLGTANVTASAPGFTSATVTVQVTATVVFPQNLTISGISTQNLPITLSAPAKTPVTVNVTSSNKAVATVPGTVTFPANATTANIPVTAVAEGQAIIRASAPPNIAEATATVTVQSGGAIGVPASLSVGLGQAASLTVTLPHPAPAGGVTVTLSSGDNSKVTLTATSITIPEGATSPGTQPKVNGVNFGTAAVTASSPGYTSGTTSVQVTGSISFSPSTLTISGSGVRDLTLNLSGPAPAGGVTITVTSSSPAVATVPNSVTIAAGNTSVSVPVTGVAQGQTVIHAAAPPHLADTTAQVTVQSGIILPSNITVEPGQTIPFPVTLSSPASGAIYISLSSSDTSKVGLVGGTVIIQDGQTAPAAPPRITGVSYGTATITASAGGYMPASQEVRVGASLSFVPAKITIVGTITQNAGIALSSAAPGNGLVVNLVSSNTTVITVPASVTIPGNASNVSVPITAHALGSATITASTSVPTVTGTTAEVTVTAPGSITLGGDMTVSLGQNVPLTVTLGTPAPAGGVTVNLTSSNPSRVRLLTPSVFIPESATTPATPAQLTSDDVGPSTLTATATGYSQATSTVTVRATMNFQEQNVTLVGKASQILHLALSWAAPMSGIPVSLSSSDPAVAQVQSVITFYGDGSNPTILMIPVTGVAPGTATIRATSTYLSEATVKVTVLPTGAIIAPSGVSLTPGQTAPFAISLGTPAPTGGVEVTLVSSDAGKVTVSPGTVTIAGGQTSPASQPQVTGVGFGTANITASAPGYNTAVQAVQVGGAISFSPQNPTIQALSTVNVQLALSVTAPAGGVAVNLSSDKPAVATVPANVTIAAGTKTVDVPVTALAEGNAVITASAAVPNIPNAIANVTVTSAGTLGGPGNFSMQLGQSAPFAISLPKAAPAGGVQVTLSTSDATKVTVPPAAVVIAQGQTTPATQPQITAVGLGAAIITASAPGYTPATGTVQVSATAAFSPQNLTITGTATQSLNLQLSAAAPNGGVRFNLSSSNPGVATVPGTVTIAAGTNAIAVPVTGVAAGGAVIRASAANIPDATANITVQAPGTIALPSGATVALGQKAPFAISLPAPAASDVTVTLASSDPSKVSISPASVLITAGNSTPAAQPEVRGLDIGSVNIMASAQNYISASAPVTVTATVSFAPQNVTITGLTTQQVALNLSAPAPATGLTVNLTSGSPGVVTVPASATFAPGAASTNITLSALALGSAVVHAAAPPYIADAIANVTVASAGPIVLPANTSIALGQTAQFIVSLPRPAPADLTVTLSSSDPAKVGVDAAVTITAGQSAPATQAKVTGLGPGTANITASAPGYAAATVSVQVTATVAFASQNVTISGLETQNVTLNLSGPAPDAGLTVNLTSSNTGVATVPGSVTFPAKATSVTVPVTGVALGSAVIHAGAPPVIPDATTNVTVQTAGALSLSGNSSVALGQPSQLTVTLPSTALKNVTVTLTSSDTGIAAVATTVTIPANQTSGTATLTGVNIGTATISASAPGYTTASKNVDVTASVNFVPNTVTINGLTTQNIALSLSAAAPSTGLTVTLSSDAPAVASVPAKVTFAAGSKTAQVAVTTLASGMAVIHAGAPPYVPDATASVTVNIPVIGNIVLTNTSIGRDLQVQYAVSLSAPAPQGGVPITLKSSDASKLLIAGYGAATVGAGTLTVTIPEGQSSVAGFYLQALVDNGTATVSATTPPGNWTPATATVTLTPSGFIVAGPNGIGVASFATYEGSTTPIIVYPARLDASRLYQETQLLRGGISATVPLSTSDTLLGTIAPAVLTFSGGVDPSLTAQFTARKAGNVTVTAGTPSGFSTPGSGGNQVQANIAAIAMTPFSVTVGHGLQAPAQVQFKGAPATDISLTITSSAADKLLFATSPTIAGQPSITIPVGAGRTASGEFYVIGAVSAYTGPVDYTITATGGFGSAAGTVTVARSGIVIAGPFGMGNVIRTQPGSAPTQLTIYSGWLDASRNFQQQQSVAGPSSVSVSVTIADPTIGTVSTSPVSIAPGYLSATSTFQPLKNGTSTISVSQPPGFTVPAAYASVGVEVNTAGIYVPSGLLIGKNLQEPGLFTLGSPAPAGGVTVTITSESPKLKVSANGTDAGFPSVTIDVPAGGTTGTFYLYGMDSAGTVTYTAGAPGYATRQASVDLTPSGVVLEGMFPVGWGAYFQLITGTAGGADVPFYVRPARLDAAGNFIEIKPLAGGISVPVALTSSSTAIGTVPSSVTIAGGTDSVTAQFKPLAAGSTTITADAGGIYTPVLVYNSLKASVN